MSYLPHPCLLTDYYQYTMAQAYFERGRAELPAVFHLFFRKNPFRNPWTLICGVKDAMDFVKHFRFDKDSLGFLGTLKNADGPIFSQKFLDFLASSSLDIEIVGMKDGQVAFPFTPVLRVSGPLFLCQILETPLLNIINYQSLIATKAARISKASNHKPIMEFGLRRAQGFDGAISGTKAAFVGGINLTSNLWAAKEFSIEAGGTMAHSFIMSYGDESKAFDDFADIYPKNCSLLVDTYDPVAGIENAIKTFLRHKKPGVLQSLRIDSGNLLELSRLARLKLDSQGLHECRIIASGDLDEYEIERLEESSAPIDIYGVGTRLITAHDDPALSGVYKLASIFEHGAFKYPYKVQPQKGSWPGPQAVDRVYKNGEVHDHVYDALVGPTSDFDGQREALHHPLFTRSQIYDEPILESKNRAQQSISSLPTRLKVFEDVLYPVHFDDVLVRKKH